MFPAMCAFSLPSRSTRYARRRTSRPLRTAPKRARSGSSRGVNNAMPLLSALLGCFVFPDEAPMVLSIDSRTDDGSLRAALSAAAFMAIAATASLERCSTLRKTLYIALCERIVWLLTSNSGWMLEGRRRDRRSVIPRRQPKPCRDRNRAEPRTGKFQFVVSRTDQPGSPVPAPGHR